MITTRTRRGFTVIELTVSFVFLGAMTSLIVTSLQLRSIQQRAVERRELATIEAGNLMEQITALAWDDLTSENLKQFALSDATLARVPGMQLKLQLLSPTEPDKPAEKPTPVAKQVCIEIDLPAASGTKPRPVSLTSWVYRPPSTSIAR